MTDALSDGWMTPAILAIIVLAIVMIAHRAAIAVMRRLWLRWPAALAVLKLGESPGLAVASLFALQVVLQGAPDDLSGMAAARHTAAVLLIGAITWLVVRMTSAIAEVVSLRYPADVADNLNARRIQTQTRVLTRTLASIAVIVGLACALLTIPGVRNIGASLLASAGIAGLIAGIAAKPVLGNLFAGLQIALTQPLRLDDVVVIEGEWGRIEEIGRTYVVVAVWDQRRLIVPLQQIVENPFQNWTRTGSEILGTVMLWVDYAIPVEALRAELKRICEDAPQWDGRVCIVQVTDANERAMQLRALVSSSDAARNWDLRCLVRERLVAFVQHSYPGCLPRLRFEPAESKRSSTGKSNASADRRKFASDG